jgi:hypothetical protein
MSDLKTAAKELVKALEAVNKALEKYASIAQAVGDAAPDGATYRGLNQRQLRQRLKAEVVARLSPKRDSLLQLEGAPEARRFIAARPLLGFA